MSFPTSSLKEGGNENKENRVESFTDMETHMRKQIQQLQEQRAAAMMNEVVDLQRERDLAVGRIKTLKKTIEDLTLENAVLKSSIGRGDLTDRLTFLERSILEEQLMSNDLRKKLQKAKEENHTLQGKLKSNAQMKDKEKKSVDSPSTTGLNSSVEMLKRERSHSMNDLTPEQENVSAKQTTIPSNSPIDSPAQPSQKRSVHSPLLKVTNASPSFSSTTYSPTVIPRRYKLAAAVSRSISTQTDSVAPLCQPAPLTDGKMMPEATTKVKLQNEKMELEGQLSRERTRRKEDAERHRISYEALKTECTTLKDSLTEFSRWVRQKIQLAEEDMDIFKVVYSLHGSLSQEVATLSDLHTKLGEAEQKIVRLEASKVHLAEVASQAEDKYKQAQREIGMLRAKLSLFTPSSHHSPTLHNSSPSHTHRRATVMKASSTNQLQKTGRASKHNSPLFKHSSPLLANKLVIDANRANDIV